MKYSMLLIIIVAVIVFSCNNESKKSTEEATMADTTKSIENKIMIPQSTCYMSVTGKDTFNLKLEKFPNVVTGTLSYNFYEKDDNNGTIDGLLNGDTLTANYTFKSEGKSSIRQVAFLITDSSVIEGFAPMEKKEDKMMFKELKEINFKSGTKFIKIQCPIQ